MFYPEIMKIIEAGLNGDKNMVKNYSILLSERLMRDGEERYGKRIEAMVSVSRSDSSSASPVSAMSSLPAGNQVISPAPQRGQEEADRMEAVDIVYKPAAPEIILTDSVRERLDDFENTIKMKDKLDALGMPFNMSLLLYGPPGCGKTSIANYLAARLELPLVTARLDGLISSLLGDTAKNLRRMFDYASGQPCILFLDEFDAIAKARDDQFELGELKRVVNSLLQNMDAYCQNGIMIAATNHQELLDNAIWRRFQTVIEVPKPGADEILLLLKNITRVLDMSQITQKQYTVIIEQLEGMSYSEIQTLVQNVVKHMIIKNKTTAAASDFLCEIAASNCHGNASREELIRYLLKCGISQRAAAEHFHVSQRQVRNCMVRSGHR